MSSNAPRDGVTRVDSLRLNLFFPLYLIVTIMRAYMYRQAITQRRRRRPLRCWRILPSKCRRRTCDAHAHSHVMIVLVESADGLETPVPQC